MRLYENCLEAAKEIERDLIELGQTVHPETMQDLKVGDDPNYKTKEIWGYGYSISKWLGSLSEWVKYFKLDKAWIEHEFYERARSPQPLNPGAAWLKRREVWEPFLHAGQFAYTYSQRFYPQLMKIEELLRKMPNTRQAVITVYDQHADIEGVGGSYRVPCSMHYQFLIRLERGIRRLHLIYCMRSSDFYTHFPYDTVLAMRLQQHLAIRLNIEVGSFMHFIGSLHAYYKDYSTRGVF